MNGLPRDMYFLPLRTAAEESFSFRSWLRTIWEALRESGWSALELDLDLDFAAAVLDFGAMLLTVETWE